ASLDLVIRHEDIASSLLWHESWENLDETQKKWVGLQAAVSAFTSFINGYQGKEQVSLNAVVAKLAEGDYKTAAQELNDLESKFEPEESKAAARALQPGERATPLGEDKPPSESSDEASKSGEDLRSTVKLK